MTSLLGRRVDRPSIAVGMILLSAAAVVGIDAGRTMGGFTYGISPAAVPMVVAAFLAALGVGHFVTAFRRGIPTPEPADWRAVGLMASALFSLMAALVLGGGFILGSALLFALTARSFGRRAFLVDLVLGLVIGLLIFLLFNNLLTLTLPEGPLERLL